MSSDTERKISNGQRALWTFLFFMLIMPFFGALAGVVMLAFAVVIGMAPEPFANVPIDAAMPKFGAFAIAAFVWSVIPSALTAISVFPMVLKHGTLGWFVAGACGVIAFTAAIVLFPFPTGVWQPVIAFIAGVIAVISRNVLQRGGILLRDQAA